MNTAAEARTERVLARRLFALLLFTFLLLASREPPWADARIAYLTTQSIVERGALDIRVDAPAYFFTVHDGRKYGFASVGNALALIPSYATFRLLRRLPGVPQDGLFAFTSHLSSALWMAAVAALFYRLCRRWRASPRLAVALSLTLGLCTLCLCYARSPYSEALQTLALLWLLEGTLAQAERFSRGGMLTVGLAAGILVTAKLVNVLLLPWFLLYLCFAYLRPPAGHDRATPAVLVRRLLWALLGFAPFVALAAWHNWVKTGTLLHTGYQGKQGIFSGDLIPGLYGYLFSSGKSIFLYSPPLLLSVLGLRTAWRQARREVLLALGVSATMMVFSAKYQVWHGDYSWGPRYMAPLTPLLLWLAVPWLAEAPDGDVVRRRRRQWLLGGLAAAGLCVQLLGASFYWDHYIRILGAIRDQTESPAWSEDHYAFGYYIPQFSPVRGHAWLLSHWVRKDPDLDRDAPWKSLLPRPVNLTEAWLRLRLDHWSLDWFTGPTRRRPAGAVLLTLLLGGALLSGFGVWRRLRDDDATA